MSSELTFIDYALRSTAILALAGTAVLVLRGRSAAWRHLIWLAGLVALLALPAAEAVAPRWNAPLMSQSVLTAPVRTVINVTAATGHASRRRSGVDWLLITWLAGAAFFTMRLARAQMLAHRLARRALPGPDGALISNETDIPLVVGLLRPVVVLPVESEYWPPERLASVLQHEQMHIARRDTLSQAFAQLACAVYWPQPLVWLAASAMRNTCEQACDDGVLSQGTRPSTYAGHLMEIARALNPAHAVLEGGIAMTRTNQLEQRISALLNAKRDRRPAGASFAATVAALAVTVVIAMAAIRTPLLAQSGRLNGVVSDPTGAVIASARIDLRSHPGSLAQGVTPVHEVVKTNGSGEYSFESIPDGAYDITIVSPGFAKQEHQGVLFESAKAKPMNVMLAVGSIQEKMQVTAERTSMPAIPAQSGPPKRIRVGGNVQAANLIHKVTPFYPPSAKADGVEGTVIMKAVIGKDGSVLSLEQTNKLVDPRLAEVALEAVKQWQYKPTLLNGEPIEVVTEIEVNFTLAR